MSADQETRQAVRKHKADLAYWRRELRRFRQHLHERNMEDARRRKIREGIAFSFIVAGTFAGVIVASILIMLAFHAAF